VDIESIRRNRLGSRSDVEQLLRDLAAPLASRFTPGRAGLRLGATRAWYGEPTGLLEAFSRPLWGIVPLAAGGGRADDLWPLWREGLANGTDPKHPEFWGWTADFDQRLVETTILALGIALAPGELWTPLHPDARARVLAWMERAGAAEPFDNNWRFFRVLINVVLRSVGGDWSARNVEADLRRIDQFYLGGGWYADGEGRRGDYYVPWAMHFYGLIYAQLAGETDRERAAAFRERARQFAQDFLHWFAADGSAIPFGRSLTYRAAQGAFWGALAFAGVEGLPWGVVKGLYLRHLRWWMGQPILSESGVLTIGYQYPNPAMAENYTTPGSPYWAFKAFLPLAVPAGHPFWSEPEAPMPARRTVHTVPAAGFVLMADRAAAHVVALNAGQPVAGFPRHAAQKYSKFAYSTRFAFAVPAGSGDVLAEGGFDSVLALSDDGVRFRPRDHCLDARAENGVAYGRWRPWPDVEVRTWLIAADSLHLRVHRLRTGRALWSAEAGFAVGYENRAQVGIASAAPGAMILQSCAGGSGMRDLAGRRAAECVFMEPGSSLASPLAAMPVLRAMHRPGEEWLVCAAGGWPGPGGGFSGESDAFALDAGGGGLAIRRDGRQIWRSGAGD
jgi:hypothetical protein